ncbi:hypothetical protein [Hyphomonas sp. ND6WE1B]|uniref:hypothetical protein n=1 Tax=Hyphomonas sp. ND6WE1B TaxID=1848191 RepID=UPI0008076B4F|nr:hypothetical protein [Hyphomonas sp. ND6WE1B]
MGQKVEIREVGADWGDQCAYGRELADDICGMYDSTGDLPRVMQTFELISGGVKAGFIARLMERAAF